MATVSIVRGLSFSKAWWRFGCKNGRDFGCQTPVGVSSSCASLRSFVHRPIGAQGPLNYRGAPVTDAPTPL
eukprot:4741038-Pyramimonas_sp.AAC.1